MQTIELKNQYLRASFIVDDNQRVYFDYLGQEENYLSGDIKDRTLIEIETSQENHNGNHCSKLLMSPFASSYLYQDHKIIENEKFIELIISLKNDKLLVSLHYLLHKNSSSLSVHTDVKNISNQPVTLESISSLRLYGLGGDDQLEAGNGMFIHKASNSWHCEAQWQRRSFLEEDLFNGNNTVTMKRYSLNNVGSWSTKDYLPMLIIENQNKRQFLLAQIEHNGSWHFEIGDLKNYFYLVASGPNFLDSHWCKILKTNDVFETVPVTISLGNSFEKVIQEITKARRNFLKKSQDNEELPVIFNDYMHALWDLQTEALIRPLVDIASLVGCEEFVIDAGWFAKGTGWTDYIGNWVEYSDNFPDGGLKGTIDYIRSKGMKAGIWVEIENMGIKCELADKLPDDYFFMVNGKRAIRNNRYCLNFANPKAYQWAMDAVSALVEKYHLDYLKNDYNLDAGIGNEYDSDSLGDGLLKHNRAFTKWLEELMERYPHLTIENCGSGGCRMDYALLKLCPIQSTSDQTDYRKYPYLSSAVLTACTPEQAAVWSYPLNKQIKQIPTDEVVIMNMVNAMLGRIHLSSFVNELTPKQIELVKEGVQYFKDNREFKKNSLPIFPNGISYFFDNEVVGGLIKDKHIQLCVWNTSGSPRTVKAILSKYNIKNIKVGYPKNEVTNFNFEHGILAVEFKEEYGGRVFDIELE